MIMMKVLSSSPVTCFVIASDLTAGQSKVGDLFRQSQNLLSVFFWPGEECQPAIVVDPVVQARSRLSMFSTLSSFQVLAPIINVFKLDSGQLKWVFVLQT